MGNGGSTLDASSVFQSLMSDAAPTPEQVERLLSIALSGSEMEQVLPLETVRRFRHWHTRNFAIALHECIRVVGAMASRQHFSNEAGNVSSPGAVPPSDVARLLSALLVLRRLLPVALESDDAANAAEAAAQGAVPKETKTRSGASATATTGAAAPSDEVEMRTTVAGGPAGGGEVLVATTLQPHTQTSIDFPVEFFSRGSTCDSAEPSRRFPLLPGQARPAAGDRKDVSLPLGTYLVRSLVDCCFVPGLTLPLGLEPGRRTARSPTHPEVYESALWQPGIASSDPNQRLVTAVTPAMTEVRVALLQTLLSATSNLLYHGSDYRDSIFMEPLLSISTVPLLPTLVISMLNTVLNYQPYGRLPYSSHLVSNDEQLVMASAKLLCAVLCCAGIPVAVPRSHNGSEDAAAPTEGVQEAAASSTLSCHPEQTTATSHSQGIVEGRSGEASPPAKPREEGQHKGHERSSSSNGQNALSPPAYDILHVHSARKTIMDTSLTEANLLVERFSTVIGVRTYAQSTILPDSQRVFPTEYQFMILLLRLMEISPSINSQLVLNPAVLRYLVPIMNYGMEARGQPGNISALTVAVAIICQLSESRSFALLCNRPFTERIPFAFPRQPLSNRAVAVATYNDFLVVALCQVLADHRFALLHQTRYCSAVLANLAPFITELCPAASAHLVSTFALYAHRTLKAPLPSDTASTAGRHGSSPNLCDTYQRQQQQQQHPQQSQPAEVGQAATAVSSDPHQPAAATVPPQLTAAHIAQNLALQQYVLLTVTEAIASLLMFHENGSRYVLACLIDHATVINKTKEVYLVNRTRPLLSTSGSRFLVDCLDAAVAEARPAVESVNALPLTLVPHHGRGGERSTAGRAVGEPEEMTYGDNSSDRPPAPGDGAAERGGNTALATPATVKHGSASNHSAMAAFFSSPPLVFSSLANNAAVMEKLKGVTLVGALGSPHDIFRRRMFTESFALWLFLSFWTSTYTHTPGGWMGDRYSVKLLRFD